jgi:endonuclease/exonuclease/phosphatase family metal-dependent hydrolase
LQFILAGLGSSYTPVVIVPEFQIDLTAQFGVRFTDQDVILARSDLANTLGAITGNSGQYTHQFQVPASQFLPAFKITRGWASVDAVKAGTKFRFITTHLVDGTNTSSPMFALVQAQQEIELISGPASTPLPVIIGGDFNTVANNPFTLTYLTYSFMLANGFIDAWSVTHPFQIFSGATCCQEDLTMLQSELTQRLDQVFVLKVGVVPGGTQRVGIPNTTNFQGIWPSDHAGVKSMLQVGSFL